MNDLSENTRAVIGGNFPPVPKPATPEELHLDLDRRYEDFDTRFKALVAAAEAAPSKVENDEISGKMQDLVKQIRVLDSSLESTRKIECEPYKAADKAVSGWFTKRSDVLSEPDKKKPPAWKEKLSQRIEVYLDEKAAAEKLRREEEARIQRETAERLAQEAQEAEQRRVEAEQRRIAEEKRLHEAEEAKLRAQREAAEAEARAAEAKEREAKLKREAAEWEKQETERRRIEAAAAAKRQEEDAERRKEQQVEADRLAAEAAARRVVEEAKLAEAREQRLVEEQKATAARIAAASARQEETKARAGIRGATADVKEAAKDEKSLLGQAVRSEKRADRMDVAAGAKDSELAQTRSDYGVVGTLATRWKYRVVDREKIPLEKLRYFLNPEAVDAAIWKFMQAGQRDLAGVEFYEDTNAIVV